VGDDQIDLLPGEHLECFRNAAHPHRPMAGPLERRLKDQTDRGFVVDVEDRRHEGGPEETTRSRARKGHRYWRTYACRRPPATAGPRPPPLARSPDECDRYRLPAAPEAHDC